MTCVHEVLLESFIKQKRVPHLLLFTGNSLPIMKRCALDFAKKWLIANSPNSLLQFTEEGKHPDLHIMTTEGKSGLYSIASIREMTERMAYAPFQAAGSAFIIESAERMLPASANALLKSFEEPISEIVIILITTKEALLLPTIRSRCVKISFHEARAQKSSIREYAPLLEKLSMLSNTSSIVTIASELASQLESKKKAIEKEAYVCYAATLKEMSAQEKHKLEIEIDGVVTAKWHEEVDTVLLSIYELLRDRVALDYAVDAGSLFSTQEAIQLPSMSLDEVNDAISFTKLSIERGTPLSNAFELLFFKFRNKILRSRY